MIKHKNKILTALLLTVMLTGCSNVSNSIETEVAVASRDIFAMDTFMTLTGYGEKCEEAVEAAVQEIERLDTLFSVGNENSEIWKLNHEGSTKVSEDTEKVICQALELYENTDGVFDISIYPMMELWGFTSENFKKPSQEAIENTLKYVDASKIQYDEESKIVEIQEGQGVDLGGIAKGYTSDRVMQIFEEYGLVSGIVSLGGNVQCYSGKVDGSPWRCGIQDPDEKEGIMCVVSVKDKAVITSGAYERYFVDEESGETWHHILNPKTGYSADSGLSSVTIVSSDGMLADGLSTAVFIMGVDQSIDYWKKYQDLFDMILVTEDRGIYITEGIKDSVSCNYPINVVSAK